MSAQLKDVIYKVWLTSEWQEVVAELGSSMRREDANVFFDFIYTISPPKQVLKAT